MDREDLRVALARERLSEQYGWVPPTSAAAPIANPAGVVPLVHSLVAAEQVAQAEAEVHRQDALERILAEKDRELAVLRDRLAAESQASTQMRSLLEESEVSNLQLAGRCKELEDVVCELSTALTAAKEDALTFHKLLEQSEEDRDRTVRSVQAAEKGKQSEVEMLRALQAENAQLREAAAKQSVANKDVDALLQSLHGRIYSLESQRVSAQRSAVGASVASPPPPAAPGPTPVSAAAAYRAVDVTSPLAPAATSFAGATSQVDLQARLIRLERQLGLEIPR